MGMARVAVVGSGFIGRAWAITFARAGHDVALWDDHPDAPHRAIEFIASVASDLAANDLLAGSSPEAPEITAAISLCPQSAVVTTCSRKRGCAFIGCGILTGPGSRFSLGFMP